MALQSVINQQHGLNISYQKEYKENAPKISAIDKQITSAKQQLANTTKQAAIATRTLTVCFISGLALIGGPVGAAMLAAGAIYYLWNQMQ